jgi:hypothetical protein
MRITQYILPAMAVMAGVGSMPHSNIGGWPFGSHPGFTHVNVKCAFQRNRLARGLTGRPPASWA